VRVASGRSSVWSTSLAILGAEYDISAIKSVASWMAAGNLMIAQAMWFSLRLSDTRGLMLGACGLMVSMELHAIRMEIPSDGNIIIGHSHFIKTVEDIYEAIVNTVPQMKFGIAFNEASGACLTRVDGNDDELQAIATKNASAVGAGHLFGVALRGGFPINVKNRILETPEVCTIFCATANPVEVIVAQTEQGRGVLGVIDGSSPKGVETAADAEWRHGFLRKIGYKK
jgi:uncharacterized protein